MPTIPTDRPIDIRLAVTLPAPIGTQPGEDIDAWKARVQKDGHCRLYPEVALSTRAAYQKALADAAITSSVVVTIPAGPPQFYEHERFEYDAGDALDALPLYITSEQMKNAEVRALLETKAAAEGRELKMLTPSIDPVAEWVTGANDKIIELSAADYDDPQKYAAARAVAIKTKKFLRRRGANL